MGTEVVTHDENTESGLPADGDSDSSEDEESGKPPVLPEVEDQTELLRALERKSLDAVEGEDAGELRNGEHAIDTRASANNSTQDVIEDVAECQAAEELGKCEHTTDACVSANDL